MWNDLSLKQKADLFKLYVANGITSIDSIKEHYNKFADGGKKDNKVDAITGAHTNIIRTNELGFPQAKGMFTLDTFNKDWYNYRVPQINRSYKYYGDHTTLKSPSKKIDEAFTKFNNIEEFTFDEALKNPSARESLVETFQNMIEDASKTPSDKDLNLLHILIEGMYDPKRNTAIYFNGAEKGSTRVHERAHSVPYFIKESILKNKYNYIDTYRKSGVERDPYLDSGSEINSRLNQFRYINNLDPTHIYNIEEIQNMRKNAKDVDLLKRYNDDFILHLLNDVAKAEEPIQISNLAATGGYLDNLTYKPFSYSPIPQVRYANGGPKQSFRRWSKAITDYKGIDVKHDDTYDYRGFYNDNPDYAYSMLGENPEAHFPDTWKTPKHPTFSDESIYSNDKTLGGHWVELPNDKWEFQHSDFTYKHSDETNQYLRNEDPNSYATYQGGIVLDGASHGLKETKAKLFAPFYGKSFDEAFSKAKSKDKEFFRWKGNLYNTRLAPNNTNMKESFDTLSDIVNRIKLYENSKDSSTGGYDKNKNVWYPHNSPEGGAKTIGYGIKLSNGSKWAKLAKSQGYLTDAQMEDAVSDLAQQHLDNSSRIFNKRFGEGAFEALDPRMQSILTDFDYNPGLSKFPKLMTAVYNNDIDSIYNEYKRYLGKKELGRNKGIKQELDTIFKK